ncbi:DUF4062 domain-containing protein [Spirosoma sp. HMF4905]|uniref:DUF4062 domain-containing protein n=1 Tax=Spirosoma arboris TaxID=2682092 RepID=A0A7K1SM50_9BACT|nr:DUF4062 domain-containing protein [Spirosoma arboris]MVM34882.1 DUF4062 domain-containing protein [Spirosoma arboris]
MAKPRVFISSTHYDLRHIRYSLDNFIERLGYEAILSEKGDIAYSFDLPLDESCYREIENIDVFVIIIGGRYGSETSKSQGNSEKLFYDRYESITKKEYEAAVKKDIPVYILIETNVYAEYKTFLKNRSNTAINYAHVDSINIFYFLEEILVKPRNNPIHNFDKFDEIENWLREQWAGLFRELLNRKTQQNQIRTLAAEVAELQEVNKTLKTYLEAVLKSIKPESEELIKDEDKRLSDVTKKRNLEENDWIDFCVNVLKLNLDTVINLIVDAKSFDDYIASLPDAHMQIVSRDTLSNAKSARDEFNNARELLKLPKFTKLPTGLNKPIKHGSAR